MFAIWTKVILAILITLVPIFYVSFIKPKKGKSSIWENSFTLIGSKLPKFKKTCMVIKNFWCRLYRLMHRFDSARKFFLFIIFAFMILLQFVDMEASQYVVQSSVKIKEEIGVIPREFLIKYAPFVTSFFTAVFAFAMSCIFLRYKWSDKLLNSIHNNKKTQMIFYALILVVLLLPQRWFIVAEIMYVIYVVGVIYPNRCPIDGNGGKKELIDFSENKKVA